MNAILKNLNPKRSMLGIALCAVLLLVLPFIAKEIGNTAWVRILDSTLLYIMLALGLNLVVGFAGLLDLGYVAFYAVGAYVAALLSSPHLTDNFPAILALFPSGMHAPFWVIVPLAAAFAAFAGILLGTPILKLRGDYLALVTLGFGEIIRIYMNNWGSEKATFGNLTNGPRGIADIQPVSMFGHSLNETVTVFGMQLTKEFQYYYLFLALVLISIFVCTRLQNSRLGRAWMALREDDIAAKAMGINVRNIKLLAFSLGAIFGGVSGAMFASFQGFIEPTSFGYMESITILAMVVLGGMGHIPGVILGAILMSVFPELLRYVVEPLQKMMFGTVLVDTPILRQLLLGLAMILTMLYKPKGLWPTPTREDKKDDSVVATL
jgi:branched-chain amino acid transport system permease protein